MAYVVTKIVAFRICFKNILFVDFSTLQVSDAQYKKDQTENNLMFIEVFPNSCVVKLHLSGKKETAVMSSTFLRDL